MISLIIDVFLLVLLVLIAVMVVQTCKLYAVIVMSGAYSLMSAVIFVNLDGNAGPLSPQLKKLDKILHNYHHELRNLLFTNNFNWRL